ncbi:hypothetical protein B0H19DRAFT_957879, partial [Mycena capillaripes]
MTPICENCGHHNGQSVASPLTEYSRSTTPVSPAQQRVHLDGIRLRIDEIRSTILRYETYLQALEEKQRELETALSTIVYPVLTLPPEIVSRIFVECLPSHGRVRPSPRTPPLVLAQICQKWREIALTDSILW